jgi:hypothetical protein
MLCRAPSARAAICSCFLIAALNAPEATKLNASTKTAYGAVNAWISPPRSPDRRPARQTR